VCASLLKALLEGLGCDARYIGGTYVFAVTDCEIPEGFQHLEAVDFHSLTGFRTDDIRYVFYGRNSTDLAYLLEYGPVQLPSSSLKLNVFYFYKEDALWFRFLAAMGAESIDKDTGAIKLGKLATLYLRRVPISSEKSVLERLRRDNTPVVLLTSKDLQLFGKLKNESLSKDRRGCFSRLQIVREQTLRRFDKYTQVNVLSALVTKSGGVPYTLEISLPLTNNLGRKFENLLNSGVFIGIALGKAQHGYYKAAASIITVDLTVKLCYHTLLEGSSMEILQSEIGRFVIDVAEELRQLADERSVKLVAIFSSSGVTQGKGEELLRLAEKMLFEEAKKLGKRPVILAIGVSKSLPLLAEEKGDLVWVVKEGEEHGILLYKFHGFKNAVRIEYHAGGALEEVELGEGAKGGKRRSVAGLVLATYEYVRRLDVMGPYPIEQKVLPAPIQFARRRLKWSQVKWEWIR